MFWRALFAFLMLPGMVAFVLPALWIWQTHPLNIKQPMGLAPLAVGVFGLLWCVRDFYVQGKGTLAPWSPPSRLVVIGLYRFSRNPMYISVILILLGWASSFVSWALLGYAALIALGFHLRVVLGEEPWLAKQHGADWVNYVQRIPRWIF